VYMLFQDEKENLTFLYPLLESIVKTFYLCINTKKGQHGFPRAPYRP